MKNRTHRSSIAGDVSWCIAMVVVALAPLLGPTSSRSVALVACLGLVAGLLLTVARRVIPPNLMAGVFVLTLLIGGLVTGTHHVSLALSWVGGTMFAVFATSAFQRTAPKAERTVEN